MEATYLMGLDVGGRSGRCILLDVNSGKVFAANRCWEPHVAPGSGGFGYEIDTAKYKVLLAEAVREALGKAGAAPQQIVGIAVVSARHSSVLISKDGKELAAYPNKDGRAAAECMTQADELGAELNERTGHFPMPIFTAARLQWLKNSVPELYSQIKVVLSLSDWIAYVLTGKAATDPTQAGETCLLDLKTRKWAPDLLKKMDISSDLLPPVKEPGSKLGTLTREAAELLGLVEGIPVAVGGADTQLGLLAMGAVKPGDLGIVAGSTTPLQMVVDKPLVDSSLHIWSGQYVLPGTWVLESNAGAMGEALDWFSGVLYPESPDPVAKLIAQAGKAKPGAGGLLSTFGSQIMNASMMSMPVGNLALSNFIAGGGSTRRANITRAILEGLAYSVKANAEQILTTAQGITPNYFMTGGMSRSDVWDQMVSDVLNQPVKVAKLHEASGLGAVVCAGVAAGAFKDLKAGADKVAQMQAYQPQTLPASVYATNYGEWKRRLETSVESDAIAGGLIMQGILDESGEQGTTAAAAPKLNTLVTAQMDETSLARLRELGDVTYASYRESNNMLTGDDLVQALKGYNVFITEIDIVDVDALKQLPDLKVVATCRGNPVNIDIPVCTAFGVPVLNAPGRNADAVADLALAFMLMLSRKLAPAINFLHEPGSEAGDMGRMGQAFSEFFGNELWKRTVGLVGLGAVGRGVAKRLNAFGARVLVFDPYLSPNDVRLLDAEPASLDDLLAQSDIVSLHAAVTDETRGMIGAAQFAKMKPGAYFVNTARAALLDEPALIEALRSGHLGGAALDVFVAEPPGADDPLLALPNVIATPHIGGNTSEVAAHQGQIIADDLQRMLNGQEPRAALNKAALEGFSWTGAHRQPSAEELAKLASTGGPAVSDLQKNIAAAPAVASVPVTSEGSTPEMTSQPAVSAASLKEQMDKILNLFIQKATADAAFQQFAAKNTVTMHFTMTDLGTQFYLTFGDGKVTGAVGAPAQEAPVRLKAKAEVLDGIFTGAINGNKAAMSGKLNFGGEVRLAMGFMKIQNDMTRLYSQARQEAGGIDLTGAVAVAPVAPQAVTVVAAPVAQPAAAGGAPSKAQMEKILAVFVDKAIKDAAFIKFAEKNKVTMHFTMTDLGTQFYLTFGDGKVTGAVGAPAQEAPVRLKAKAEVLDGIFTGAINGNKAAMSGKLNFGGEVKLAMGFMKIQNDMTRLYTQARQEAGGIDFNAVAVPVSAAVPAAVQAAPTYVAPVPTVRPDDPRYDLVEMVKELYAAQCITATGGNISVRVPGTSDQAFITPAHLFKGDLRPEMMVRIDMEGNGLDPDSLSPSSEWGVHCAIYKNRPDIEAVIHAHSPWFTILMLNEFPFLPISTEAAFFGKIPVVPFMMPGSRELANAVGDAVGKGSVVFMQNHGVVVAGATLRGASNSLEALERTAMVTLWSYAAGGKPKLLPKDIVDMLGEMEGMVA